MLRFKRNKCFLLHKIFQMILWSVNLENFVMLSQIKNQQAGLLRLGRQHEPI
jgi:hypothetical protein